jgi:hypothetical protein
MTKLLITYVLLSTLLVDPKNPRVHSPRQIRQISKSLQTFGFIVPILVDASYRIVAGHGRYLAAKLLGMTEVPIIMIEHLTSTQLSAFQIADNALNESSNWATIQLGLNLKELSLRDIDLVEVTGLDMAVVDLAIQGLDNLSSEDGDPADQIAERLEKTAVSKSGDIWIADKHRLMCGDARSLTHFKLLMGKRKAHAAFVDVPYNVRIGGHASGTERPKLAQAILACVSGAAPTPEGESHPARPE